MGDNMESEFIYQAQEEIEVFENDLGTISISSKGYFDEKELVVLNIDAAKFVIKSLTELVRQSEKQAKETV